MLKGNIKKHKGKGFVCYLDILGFSFDILNNWNDSKSNPLKTILEIKKNLPITKPDITTLRIDNEIHEYSSRVSSMSDSITISFGLEKKTIIIDAFSGLFSIVSNIKHIWSALIKKGYTVRGAIDFGDIYWDENEIIGPALINAYNLEVSVAKTSRVIVSSDLNANIKHLYELVGSELGPIILENFMRDIDGYIVFNPNILYDDEDEKNNLIKNLKKQRKKVEDKITKEKYTPLITCLEEGIKHILKISDIGRY